MKHKNWTRGELLTEVRKYETITAFRTANQSAYQAVHRMKITSVAFSHMKPIGSLSHRYVYEIANHETKEIYIGLTAVPKRRLNAHRIKKPCSKLLAQGGVFTILAGPLLIDEAVRLEKQFIREYAETEYRLINKNPGGGLGGSRKYWTYERCRIEGLKYKTRSAFARGSSGAYSEVVLRGWMNELCPHMPVKVTKITFWTFERCHEEALKYRHRKDFNDNAKSAYLSARRNGWLEDVCKHMVKPEQKRHWNYENCKAAAQKYPTRKQFDIGQTGAYQASRKYGWLDDFYPKKGFSK